MKGNSPNSDIQLTLDYFYGFCSFNPGRHANRSTPLLQLLKESNFMLFK